MLVYLAGPIDSAGQLNAESWRDNIRGQLSEEGISTYSPAHAFRWNDKKDSDKIIRINETAVAACDVVYAYIPKDVITIGTWFEIVQAHSLGIPVVIQTNITYHAYLQRFDPVRTIEQGIKCLLELREDD